VKAAETLAKVTRGGPVVRTIGGQHVQVGVSLGKRAAPGLVSLVFVPVPVVPIFGSHQPHAFSAVVNFCGGGGPGVTPAALTSNLASAPTPLALFGLPPEKSRQRVQEVICRVTCPACCLQIFSKKHRRWNLRCRPLFVLRHSLRPSPAKS
jgi:hypothetical protein